ncbi:DoxX family protein [Mucilaginibacter glaciei]|uniref:DoxX family protein n=1 Tax=Mucilaginibacter glaciei TaxID=2772109 RepID=A0A926S0Y3_9SPHI|nr:DoxX family protein [Mucilaginibacter glaciei]MBD1391599.1 DoxX family protein [Mucilaginibacter glaciei]
MLQNILILISAIAFLFYGVTFFTNSGMKEEFERYGLNQLRKLVGCLQLLGGSGLLIGFAWHLALIIASGGLSLLMLLGFGVRLKMKDGFWESMPSFLFMLLNGYICLVALGL